jgi:hypothetical protein
MTATTACRNPVAEPLLPLRLLSQWKQTDQTISTGRLQICTTTTWLVLHHLVNYQQNSLCDLTNRTVFTTCWRTCWHTTANAC